MRPVACSPLVGRAGHHKIRRQEESHRPEAQGRGRRRFFCCRINATFDAAQATAGRNAAEPTITTVLLRIFDHCGA